MIFLSFRASNSPFHVLAMFEFNPRASLYYSINNQLRLIFLLHWLLLFGSIIIRNGSHFNRQWDEWWYRTVFWGLKQLWLVLLMFLLLFLMCLRVRMKWKIIENELKMPFVWWWKQQQSNSSSAHGDDTLNCQFNLLMISWIYIIYPACTSIVSSQCQVKGG